jgi:hypothetical protein
MRQVIQAVSPLFTHDPPEVHALTVAFPERLLVTWVKAIELLMT